MQGLRSQGTAIHGRQENIYSLQKYKINELLWSLPGKVITKPDQIKTCQELKQKKPLLSQKYPGTQQQLTH